MAVSQYMMIDLGLAVSDAFASGDDHDRNAIIEALAHVGWNADDYEIEQCSDELDDKTIDGAIAFLGRLKAAKAGA